MNAPVVARLASVLLAVCLALPTAHAATPDQPADTAPQPESDEAAAERLKQEGDALMVSREYNAALKKYDESYARSRSPRILYNRARAHESLGRYDRALSELEAFDREAMPELKALVPKLSEWLADMSGKVTTLSVTSNVAGARVLINNELLGTTPIVRSRVNAGEAVVQVFADGFTPRTKQVTLPGGRNYDVDVKLASRQSTGVLEVKSNVPSAAVFIDGARIGKVPAEALLRAGTHQLEVQASGYDDYAAQVVIKPGDNKSMDVALEETTPLYQRWWLWTIVGGVVVAGAVIGGVVAATTERSADRGDIEPGQVQAPIISW